MAVKVALEPGGGRQRRQPGTHPLEVVRRQMDVEPCAAVDLLERRAHQSLDLQVELGPGPAQAAAHDRHGKRAPGPLGQRQPLAALGHEGLEGGAERLLQARPRPRPRAPPARRAELVEGASGGGGAGTRQVRLIEAERHLGVAGRERGRARIAAVLGP